MHTISRSIIVTSFLVPGTVLALNFSTNTPFSDVKATSREAVSINLLNKEGVIASEKRFYPSRLIRREEWYPLIIKASKKNTEKAKQCFRDVSKSHKEYSALCSAKELGITISQSSRLQPKAFVQYDEALRSLNIAFGVNDEKMLNHHWQEIHYDSAAKRGVDLAQTIQLNTKITRGMAARLLASYMAYEAKELTNLRLAESGQFNLIATPTSSSSTSSVSSSPSSSSSSSSIAIKNDQESHFLVLGTRSPSMVTIAVPSAIEKRSISIVSVAFSNELKSIRSLELRKNDGTVLATLTKKSVRVTEADKRTFEALIPLEQQPMLQENMDHTLSLHAELWNAAEGGVSGELIDIRRFALTLRGMDSKETTTALATLPLPKHQTSFGILSDVNFFPIDTTIQKPSAENTLFILHFRAPSDFQQFELLSTNFHIDRMENIDVSSLFLEGNDGSIASPCSINITEKTISCPLGGSTMGFLSSEMRKRFLLRGEIHLIDETKKGFLSLSLPIAGNPTTRGNIEWTDGSGIFRWLEKESPLFPAVEVMFEK